MNKKDEVSTKANSTTRITAPKEKQSKKDHRGPIQYLADRSIEAAGNELNRLEQEKPGTRRKLAGIASLGIGATGIGAGIYLLTS